VRSPPKSGPLPPLPDVRRVLVVEDDADLIVTYERLLRRIGYRVLPAATRRDGLALVAVEPLVLVISDVLLSDGDGLDVVRAATAAPRRTRAIVVTGQASEVARLAALEAGASAYFTKPFSTPHLIAAVRDLTARAPLA